MPLDLNTALNSYGFVGQLANSIPDLRNILNQAIAGQWVPEQFTRAVQDSGWWKTNADAVRKLSYLQSTDPATYTQNLLNAQGKIGMIAAQMGRTVNTNQLALYALANNWDDEQIRQNIGILGTLEHPEGRGDALGGTAGQMLAHMGELATNYGVPHSQQWLESWVTHIQAGAGTLDTFESVIRSRAKAQYAHLADQIDAGMTIRDIADPYIASMAQTLEVPETGIKLDDPAIQRALQQKDDKGGFTNQPMYEFVRKLKDDPRWEKTTNARDEAYAMVNQLGKSWGFLS